MPDEMDEFIDNLISNSTDAIMSTIKPLDPAMAALIAEALDRHGLVMTKDSSVAWDGAGRVYFAADFMAATGPTWVQILP